MEEQIEKKLDKQEEIEREETAQQEAEKEKIAQQDEDQLLGLLFLSDSIGVVIDSITIKFNNKTYKITKVTDFQNPEITNALQNIQPTYRIMKTTDENGNLLTFLVIEIGGSFFPVTLDNILLKYLYKNPFIRLILENGGMPAEIIKVDINKDYLIEEAL